MAQDRLRRRRLSNIGNRSRATNARGSASSSERDRLNKLINKRQRAPYTKPTDAELRKGNTGSRVTPVQGSGPKMMVDPKRPTTRVRHSGQSKGGQGGLPALPSPVNTQPKLKPATIRARHSGQGIGGRGGIPDVKVPRPYFKGGNVTPTKNAIGTNDYRKTGTTLSVKDNRKKTK
jgi:hypothetical protein